MTQERTAARLVDMLTTEGSVEVSGDPMDEVLALIRGEASTDPVVTYLAYGQTDRHPGYADLGMYLASQRVTTPMRLRHHADRQSHRRWLTPVTTVREVLENLNGGWQGRRACRRQAARAFAARAWYGVPNINLGA